MTTCLQQLSSKSRHMSKLFNNGTACLLPKCGETDSPKNYRPITCLPTMYKTLTSILSDRTCCHMLNNNLLPSEQKGRRKGSCGSREQLLVNKAIMKEAKSRKKTLRQLGLTIKRHLILSLTTGY